MSGKKPNIDPSEFARPFVGELADRYPPILSPTQLAGLIGKSPKTVSEWVSKGRLDGSFRKRGQAHPAVAGPRPRHPSQRQGVDRMTDNPNRVRVGERITIYPRGAKKTWVADYWKDNVHHRVSLKTSNKKVAIERATKLAADLIDGSYRLPPPAVTVRQVVDDYMTHLKTEDRAGRTLVK